MNTNPIALLVDSVCYLNNGAMVQIGEEARAALANHGRSS